LTRGQDCRQCGRCCEKWGWGQRGDIEDIARWIAHNRQDILQHILITLTDRKRRNGRDLSADDLPHIARIHYWVEPDGRAMQKCPFFRRSEDGKVYCTIHDAKPNICIGFTPWNDPVHDYALNCPACRETAP
jgi:Fe-S-cluster containining protein